MMLLSELLNSTVVISRDKDIPISGLALDSRYITQGDVFFACKGSHLDGNQFIQEAINQGASVVLSDSPSIDSPSVIFVPDLAQKIGFIASRFYGEPSKKMGVVGITGTNGKTSCSHLIAAAFQELNSSCGVIGTLGNGLYGHIQAGSLTTPDAITLQKTLAEFLQEGAKYAAMEVSSHSLDQGRVNGVDFSVSVFTNLTRDHMDYHGNMENYAAAKRKLFEKAIMSHSVINADDQFGQRLISDFHAHSSVFSYGTEKNASVYAKNIQLDLKGIRAHIDSPWGKGELHAKLMGRFNLSNILAAFTTLCLLDVPFETVLHVITTLKPVDGRMQTIGGQNKPLVVVDYSHTPDALEKALIALRYHCTGKLYCIFGCGGDRDRGKRPMMAKIAEQLSDRVVVTDDNPRTEDPDQIFNDIVTGFTHPEKIIFQHNRAEAIRNMIKCANMGDCILIAGKGAETYQIIGTKKYPFSDIEHVKLNL